MAKDPKKISDDLQKKVDKADKKVKKSLKDTKDFIEMGAQGFLSQQKIVDALAYVPYFIGPVFTYFFGDADKQKTMHHIKYAVILAVGAIILSFVLNGFFTSVLNLAYIIASAYLGFKALQGDNVQIDLLDTIEDTVSKTIKK